MVVVDALAPEERDLLYRYMSRQWIRADARQASLMPDGAETVEMTPELEASGAALSRATADRDAFRSGTVEPDLLRRARQWLAQERVWVPGSSVEMEYLWRGAPTDTSVTFVWVARWAGRERGVVIKVSVQLVAMIAPPPAEDELTRAALQLGMALVRAAVTPDAAPFFTDAADAEFRVNTFNSTGAWNPGITFD